jgi:sulfotransferase
MNNIYFLGGLPRSGNTLLSALLNQNPEVYVSPLSPLLSHLTIIDQMLLNGEETLSFDFQDNATLGMKNYAEGFYSNISKPYIIDRNKLWGNKESIATAVKYITDKPKVIFTVRDIPSILASFITLVKESKDNFIDKGILQAGLKAYGNQTQDDLRCDWLMNTQTADCLVALTELQRIQIPVCLVEYDDLVTNPQKELNDIYEFLEFKSFSHNLASIEKVEQETLSDAGLPNDLHNVRAKVEKTALDPKLVLSSHTLNKYSGLEFWRK